MQVLRGNSKDQNTIMKKQSLSQIVDEIISELPLKEKTFFANLDEVGVAILQSVLGKYIRHKIDFESDDREYNDIMNELWKRLQETHKLRVMK